MIGQSMRHLAEAREGYFEHMRFALTVGLLTIAAGLACLVHAAVPALCQKTASRTIGLITELFGDRQRLDEIEHRSSEAIGFGVMLLLAAALSIAFATSSAATEFKLLYGSLAFALPLSLLLVSRDLDNEPG